MLVLLTLAGVGLGVHFGRAAVNDIDPFYFTDPQGTHSYAALTPQGVPDSEPVDVGRFTDPDAPLGTGCTRCSARARDPVPGYEGGVDAYVASAWTPPEIPVVETVAYEAETGPDALTEERELVRLYAHYPVSEQEREAHLLAVSAVLEDDQPAAEYGIARKDEPVENSPGY